MAKGIKRLTRQAIKNVSKEIKAFANQGFYAAGLASEGYNGGYRDALFDVLLILDGNSPCCKPEWWNKK